MSTRLLTKSKKVKRSFRSGDVSRKRKSVTLCKTENLQKAILEWRKRIGMNNLPINGANLKEKAVNSKKNLSDTRNK